MYDTGLAPADEKQSGMVLPGRVDKPVRRSDEQEILLASSNIFEASIERDQKMYYRVAIQTRQSSIWQWKSTPLSSLHALLQWLQWYRAFPHDRLRIFASSSREAMNEQLARENQGLRSPSETATHFLHQRRLRLPEASGATSAPGAHGHGQTTSIAVSTATWLNESNRATLRLDEQFTCSQEKRRFELELVAGADHDVPHRFALPTSMPQVLAWIRLLVRVQREEVQL